MMNAARIKRICRKGNAFFGEIMENEKEKNRKMVVCQVEGKWRFYKEKKKTVIFVMLTFFCVMRSRLFLHLHLSARHI